MSIEDDDRAQKRATRNIDDVIKEQNRLLHEDLDKWREEQKLKQAAADLNKREGSISTGKKKDTVPYRNFCWNCHADISSSRDRRCSRCRFWHCSTCGACFCGRSDGIPSAPDYSPVPQPAIPKPATVQSSSVPTSGTGGGCVIIMLVITCTATSPLWLVPLLRLL